MGTTNQCRSKGPAEKLCLGPSTLGEICQRLTGQEPNAIVKREKVMPLAGRNLQTCFPSLFFIPIFYLEDPYDL